MHLHELTQPDAEALIREGRTAVLVAGSVEQHGPHLPLGTDWIAALGVAERVAPALRAPVVVLSPVGVAPYHRAWAGSLTLRPETLIALVVDVCTGLAGAGATRVLIVNWHEGNTPTLRLAADRAQTANPELRVLVAETHIIANALSDDALALTHAGALETAAVLARDPSLVDLERATNATADGHGDARHELFRQRDVFPVLKDFREIAPTGWYGHPEDVSQEQAEELFERVAAHVVKRATETWAELEQPA